MKKHGLIQCIGISMMLICFGVLSFLQAQNPNISVNRLQLVELTKKAEKTALLDAENTNLIVENHNLKATNKTLSQQLSTAQADAATYKQQRNKNRYALGALLLAVVVSVVLRIKKRFF